MVLNLGAVNVPIVKQTGNQTGLRSQTSTNDNQIHLVIFNAIALMNHEGVLAMWIVMYDWLWKGLMHLSTIWLLLV